MRAPFAVVTPVCASVFAAGAQVTAGSASNAGRTATLFENTEAGNGDAVTLVHRAHNRVDNILDSGGRLPTVRAQFLCEHIYELCFVHPKPSEASGPILGTD